MFSNIFTLVVTINSIQCQIYPTPSLQSFIQETLAAALSPISPTTPVPQPLTIPQMNKPTGSIAEPILTQESTVTVTQISKPTEIIMPYPQIGFPNTPAQTTFLPIPRPNLIGAFSEPIVTQESSTLSITQIPSPVPTQTITPCPQIALPAQPVVPLPKPCPNLIPQIVLPPPQTCLPPPQIILPPPQTCLPPTQTVLPPPQTILPIPPQPIVSLLPPLLPIPQPILPPPQITPLPTVSLIPPQLPIPQTILPPPKIITSLPSPPLPTVSLLPPPVPQTILPPQIISPLPPVSILPSPPILPCLIPPTCIPQVLPPLLPEIPLPFVLANPFLPAASPISGLASLLFPYLSPPSCCGGGKYLRKIPIPPPMV